MDWVIRIEPFEPILIMTHLVHFPLLINSLPARIGFVIPVKDSAWYGTSSYQQQGKEKKKKTISAN